MSYAAIPSAPLNGKETFVNASAVQLSWIEPQDTGGRSDLFYEVKCQQLDSGNAKECSSNVLFYPHSAGLKMTSVLVSGLLPFTKYTFRVYVRNGVSDVATEKPNYKEIVLTTKESCKNR